MRARRAIALFAALALMALIGLLVAGAVASSTIAQRSSRLSFTDAVLTAAADYALNTILADPRGFGLAELAFGERATFDIPVPDSKDARVVVGVTRLSGGVLWLVAEASGGGADQGRRRINVVARFPIVGAVPEAAIVARGNVHLGHDVLFPDDTTHDPDCSTDPVANVLVGPGAVVTGDTTHAAVRAVAADTATYYLTASQLAVLDGARTIIHVRGDTTITAGQFDGILIADGSVTVSGAYRMTGLIIARGRIEVLGGGFSLTGAILSFENPATGNAIELSGATIRYSSCSVARVLRVALSPRPVRQRSWVEVF